MTMAIIISTIITAISFSLIYSSYSREALFIYCPTFVLDFLDYFIDVGHVLV